MRTPPHPLRVGMIGAGHIARSHAAVWREEAEITAVCSRQRHKAEALAEAFDIPHVCEDANALIHRPDVDIVGITTPHCLHCPLSIAAMDVGKHVFCEKPLALNIDEARRMWAKAQEAGVQTGIQFSERFAWPSLIYLHDLIRTGALGQIHLFEANWSFDWARRPSYPMGWRFKREQAGAGALGDLGVYLIDAARWLMGEFTAVSGHLETFITQRPVVSGLYDFAETRRMCRDGALPEATGAETVENDDACVILATFDNGAHGVLRASRLQRGQWMRIESSEGVYRWDLQSACLYQKLHDETDFKAVKPPDDIRASSMAASFLSNIREGAALPPTFYDGMKAQEVIDAAERSHRTRRWIELGE